MTIGIILLILFYVLAPALIIWLCKRFSWLGKLGSVAIAYAFGLILGNIGILPEGSDSWQDLMTTITIPLALPLLLFSLHVTRWFRMAGKTLLSMLIALVSVILMVALGHYLWGDQIAESWKVSGLLVGVYSGGTPNLASIMKALTIDENTYIITHTYDIVLSAFYLLFLITIGKGLFRAFLPRFTYVNNSGKEPSDVQNSIDDYSGIFKKASFVPLLKAFLIAVLILAIGGGLSEIVNPDYSMVTAILTITTLGILASLIPWVNKIKKSFELGMYFILIFSIVVASLADFSSFDLSALYLFYYVILALFGSLFLHVLFSKLFKIDSDTTMITSTALICSPPFVPMIAGALKNKQVILSGLSVGIVGYAIGNYLGVFIAYLLK